MLLPLLLATACSSQPPAPRPPFAKPIRKALPRPGPVLRGVCDASTATARPGGSFLVGDDERNRLFPFDPEPGAPVALPFEGEVDLEGSARARDGIWWVASHDRGKGTSPKSARRHLFRTDDAGEVQVDVVDLWERLSAHAVLGPLLEATEGTTSKDLSGFSIEALHAEADALYVGLRAPVVDGQALLVRLAPTGPAPEVTDVLRVDLGGRGFRALEPHGGVLHGIAGPADDAGDFRLFTLDLATAEASMASVDVNGIRPEGLVSLPGGLLAISDDGKVKVDGTRCRDLPAADRRARTLWVAEP